MIRNKDILNSLPLLASALADKYGVKVSIGGKQAYTNGRAIQLPALPMDCGKTAIALAKGYLDHEAAHIRYTDFACFRQAAVSPVVKHLCNSIEDWRVEKCLSERYPGCKANLNWLIKHIFLEEIEKAGDEDPAFSILNYVLLAVRSWDVPELKLSLQQTRDTLETTFPGLASDLDRILVRVQMNCPDTKAALDYALELEKVIRAYERADKKTDRQKSCENKLQMERNSAECPEESEHESSGIDRVEEVSSGGEPKQEGKNKKEDIEEDRQQGDKKQQEEDALLSASPIPDSHGESQDNTSVKNDDGEYSGLKSLFDKEAQDLPLGLGEIIGQQLGENACGDTDDGFYVASCISRKTDRLPDEEKLAALKSSNALRHRLTGLLQAREIKHVSAASIGKLNTSKLYRLSNGNPRIFKRENTATGVNSAIHILLDASYSMENAPIRLARQTCYSLAKALGSIKGINPAVTVFPAGLTEDVYPLLKHGQKVSDRFMVEASGSTPLAPALWWVGQTLYPLPEARKIILIITDGRPDNLPSVKAAIKTLHKLGMEIYGIGIEIDAVNDFLPDSSRMIKNLTDLAPAMFSMLQNALLKGGKHDGAH